MVHIFFSLLLDFATIAVHSEIVRRQGVTFYHEVEYMKAVAILFAVATLGLSAAGCATLSPAGPSYYSKAPRYDGVRAGPQEWCRDNYRGPFSCGGSN